MKKGQKRKNKNKNGPQKLWLFGKHSVISALQNKNRTCYRLLATDNAKQSLSNYEELIAQKVPSCEVVSADEISAVLPHDATHQGVALEVAPLPLLDLEDIPDLETATHMTVAILDQVTDPRNIGAIVRSAAAFNIAAVVVTKHHSAQENGAMAKTAAGTMDQIPFVTVTNLAQALDYLKEHGFWCIGLDGNGKQPIEDIKSKYEKVALVLGAEGKGLRRLTQESCDLLVHLPISEKVESLNVSNAAAIAFYALAV